jgi:hypothetical protein
MNAWAREREYLVPDADGEGEADEAPQGEDD